MHFKSTAIGLLCVVTSAWTLAGRAGSEPGKRPHFGVWGVDLGARDPAVKPGNDFADYAFGRWSKDAVVPEDRPEAGVHMDLIDSTDARVRALILECARNPQTPNAQKIGDLYNAFMDEARIEQLDDKPLQADLERVRGCRSKAALATWMGHANGSFGAAFFRARVRPDSKAPTRNVLQLRHSGLGMPRDYYLSDGFTAQRTAYTEYIDRTLRLIGWPRAEQAARDVFDLETRMAQASWPLSERRDTSKTYNPMTLQALEAMAPAFPWREYLRGAGVETVEEMIVAEKSAFGPMATIFDRTSLETLHAWAAFQTTDQASPYLSKRFVENRFAFRGKILSGLVSDRPRWERAVIVFDDHLEDAIGREYVTRWFSAESKAEMEHLVENFKSSMAARIAALEWMSQPTRTAALEKLSKLQVMVGYPNKWRDYSELRMDRRDLYGDVQRTEAFDWTRERSKLRQPVDRQEWLLPAHAPDAYADYSRVALGFCAAYLQPPYFDPHADPAVNYGAIGAIIGHEMTHQFDDQGRRSDANGVLRDWWAPEDAARFEQEAARLVRQYESYEIVPGVRIDGRQTLGENIADLGGLLLALDAYHLALNGRAAPVVDGLTGDQRLFLGWAQIWRTKERAETLRERAASDVHSPARYRVIGPAKNSDAWYTAFDVRPGEKHYLPPADRVRIW